MNAYDLSTELLMASSEMEYNHIVNDWKLLSDSANMLRQQASELDKVIPQLVKANGIIENLRIRIAELEKDLHMTERHYERLCTQTKPLDEPLTEADAPFQKVAPKEVADAIDTALGLKRLSDEEIKQLAYQHRWNGDIDFARAIEAKVRGQ